MSLSTDSGYTFITSWPIPNPCCYFTTDRIDNAIANLSLFICSKTSRYHGSHNGKGKMTAGNQYVSDNLVAVKKYGKDMQKRATTTSIATIDSDEEL